MSFFGEILKDIATMTVAGMAALHGGADPVVATPTPFLVSEDRGSYSEHLDKGTTTRPTTLKAQGEILTSGLVGTTSSSTFALKVKDGSTKRVITTATTTINVQYASSTITKTKDLIPGGRVIVVGTSVGTTTIHASSVTGGVMEIRKPTEARSDNDKKDQERDKSDKKDD